MSPQTALQFPEDIYLHNVQTSTTSSTSHPSTSSDSSSDCSIFPDLLADSHSFQSPDPSKSKTGPIKAITWPLDRPKHQSLIPTRYDAQCPHLPINIPRAPASNTPELGQSEKNQCRVCKSRTSTPMIPIPNNPLQLGICISKQAWASLSLWCEELSEREKNKKAIEAREMGIGFVENRDEIRGHEIARRRALGRVDEEDWIEIAGDIEAERVLREERERDLDASAIDEGVEEEEGQKAWTLWLVPRLGSSKENQQEGFSFMVHAFSPPSARSTNCGRVVSPCLTPTTRASWNALRDKCLSGEPIACDLVDAGCSFRAPVQLRTLHKTGIGSMWKRVIFKMLGWEEDEKLKEVLDCHSVLKA